MYTTGGYCARGECRNSSIDPLDVELTNEQGSLRYNPLYAPDFHEGYLVINVNSPHRFLWSQNGNGNVGGGGDRVGPRGGQLQASTAVAQRMYR